jgi:hypothetical protein
VQLCSQYLVLPLITKEGQFYILWKLDQNFADGLKRTLQSIGAFNHSRLSKAAADLIYLL